MTALMRVAKEIYGLFVDDGAFALAIVLWIVLLRAVALHAHLAAPLSGFTLFVGIVILLIGSAIRFSRRHKN